ncbi:MAG: zinc dependent phospholipase C family protein [Spirochaetota bacterium]|nr:zinc dependent phospholipase C family protein [Spirochaetota bacterium]
MLYNGLYSIARNAIRLMPKESLIQKYQSAVYMGSFREDVEYFPLIHRVTQHHSFTHLTGRLLPGGYIPLLWPGPVWKAKKYYKKALLEFEKGNMAQSFVDLGRVSHILTDMACPNHVNRVIHENLDRYEVYLEKHVRELSEIDTPLISSELSIKELILGLCRFTQGFPVDRTNNPIGRLLKKLGLVKSQSREALKEQARAIFPVAVAYNVALFEKFISDTMPQAKSQAS